MTITAQRILDELASRAWSGVNKDDMVFDKEDSRQARAEMNSALRYLVNLDDFPFKSKTNDLMAIRNVQTYSMPEGQIDKIYYSNGEELTFIGEKSKCDETKNGKPTGYWIDYNNPLQSIRLYPIPDATYNLKIEYNQFKPVLDTNGDAKYEFTKADDYLNLPENLEYLFMDCLILRTMVTNNKDDQDENYAPMINEFNQVWRVFKSKCKPVQKVNRVVW